MFSLVRKYVSRILGTYQLECHVFIIRTLYNLEHGLLQRLIVLI